MNKETLKQYCTKLLQLSMGALKALSNGLKNTAVAIHKDYSDKRQVELYQIQQNRLTEIMCQIRWELFCVFRGKKYPYLKIVEAVDDIVPFSPSQYGIMFDNENATPPACGLQQLKEKMNFDIRAFRQWILLNYSLQEVWRLYPNIMSGLYIADITPNGIYAVLTVAFPQKPISA